MAEDEEEKTLTAEELAANLGIPVEQLTNPNFKHPITGNRAQRRKKEQDIKRLKKKLRKDRNGKK